MWPLAAASQHQPHSQRSAPALVLGHGAWGAVPAVLWHTDSALLWQSPSQVDTLISTRTGRRAGNPESSVARPAGQAAGGFPAGPEPPCDGRRGRHESAQVPERRGPHLLSAPPSHDNPDVTSKCPWRTQPRPPPSGPASQPERRVSGVLWASVTCRV